MTIRIGNASTVLLAFGAAASAPAGIVLAVLLLERQFQTGACPGLEGATTQSCQVSAGHVGLTLITGLLPIATVAAGVWVARRGERIGYAFAAWAALCLLPGFVVLALPALFRHP